MSGQDYTATDYALGERRHPERIELCGVCGRRLHRLGPDDSAYCEKCGRGGTRPPVLYLRAPGAIVPTAQDPGPAPGGRGRGRSRSTPALEAQPKRAGVLA